MGRSGPVCECIFFSQSYTELNNYRIKSRCGCSVFIFGPLLNEACWLRSPKTFFPLDYATKVAAGRTDKEATQQQWAANES